jgi:CBS domain-containing protein
MKSSSVMTRDVVVVSPAVTVAAAERMMDRLRIRHLPVVVGGRLVGILSDRDLLRRSPTSTCGEAMSPAPLTCSADLSVGRIAELMIARKIDSLPVVDRSGALSGLVTSSDLLALLVERDEGKVLPFSFTIRTAVSDHEALALAA